MMGTIFSGPLAQAIGWALLHLLWQGVLVAAILAATLALLRRQSANARYLASCGALLLIVVLSFITAVRAYDPIRTTASTSPTLATAESEPALKPVVFSESGEAIVPATSDAIAVMASFANSHLPEIVIVWLVGVTLLASRLVIGWLGANRLATKDAREAEPQWQNAMARIAESLAIRRTIRLLESAAVEVPTVIGWMRPVVLLPVASLSGFSVDQIEMILAHELAHIRRHDFIVNLLQSTVETLFFYQPAVWWISRRVRVEREHCCDDLAVSVSGDPIRYARALTRFEELRMDNAQAVIAANGGSLLGRIRRLVTEHGESANWSSRWAAGAALLTVVAALVLSPSLPMFANSEPTPPAPAAPPAPPAPAHASVEVSAPAPVAEPSCDTESDGSDEADDIDDIDDIDEIEMDDEDMVIAAGGAAPRALMIARAMADAGRPVIAPRAMAQAVAAGVAGGVAPMAIAHSVAQGVEGSLAEIDIDVDDHVDHKFPENGKLSVDDLIALRTAGVTPKYIEEMRAIGLGKLTLNDLAAMRIQGVTPTWIRDLRAAGVEITTPRDAIALRVQGVTGEYITGMRAAGYSNLSTRDLIAMRVQGVSPRYVKELAEAGYTNLSAKDLIALRIHGVNAEFVKALAAAGYTNLSAKDLTRLAASGVNAQFIRDLAQYKTK